jgi:chromosome segregation ATPase
LQSRIREVEILLQNAAVREQSLSERVAELQRLTQDYAGQIAEFQQLVAQKEKEIAEHAATRSEQTNRISALQTHVAELEIAEKRIATLEKTLSERETEIGGLFSAHGDMQREMQGWKDYAAQLQPMVSQIPSLENLLNEREAEISRLNEVQKEQDEQLKYLQQRVDVSSARVTAHQERIQELEPLAARVPLMEQQLLEREEESRNQVQASKDLEERHQAEITRLKLNSAQRLRRLRQGITNFKG